MITNKFIEVLTDYFFDEYLLFRQKRNREGFNTIKWTLNKYNFEFEKGCIYVTLQIENAGPFCNTKLTLRYEEIERRFKKQNRLKYMLLNI